MKVSWLAIIAVVCGLIIASLFVAVAGNAIVEAQSMKKQADRSVFLQSKPEPVMNKGLFYLLLMPADDAEIIRQLWLKSFMFTALAVGIGGGIYVHRKFSLYWG